MRFEIFYGNDKQYHFRLVASNGQIVSWGEAYTTKQNAINAANWVKQNAASAPIHDITGH